MKICPACGSEFPDDANFCPMDASKLPPPISRAASDLGGATIAMPSVAIVEPAATMRDQPKPIAGRFMVGREVARTPTGTLYESSDLTSGQTVALKLIDTNVLPTVLMVDRALRELKQLAKVKTEKIVRVVDQGKGDDGRVYVVTERVAGQTLEALVDGEGPLDFGRARQIVLAVGEALTEAQKVGVIHRDVAPRNVIVDGDRVRITDFGFAEAISDKVFGTPAFLSPEQAEGKPVDQRSNIYSLGALFYYALTGASPFSGDRDSQVQQHLHAQPQPPSSRINGLPPEVDKLVLKALEKSGGRRHLTLRQLLNEIGTLPVPGAARIEARADDLDSARTIMNFGQSPVHAAPHAAPATMAEGKSTILGPALIPIAPAGPSALVGSSAAQVPIADQITAKVAPSPVAVIVIAPTPIAPPPAASVAHAPAFVAPPAAAARPNNLTVPMSLSNVPTATAPPPGSVAPTPRAPVSSGGNANAGGGAAKPAAASSASSSGAAVKKGFRETAWFKKGELEEEMNKAAAEASKQDPLAGPAQGAEAIVDDATLTSTDRARLSLKTGRTEMMPVIKLAPVPGGQMSEEEMLAEVDSSKKWKVYAGVIIAIVAVVGVILFFFASGK